jgi:hypothetical protein
MSAHDDVQVAPSPSETTQTWVVLRLLAKAIGPFLLASAISYVPYQFVLTGMFLVSGYIFTCRVQPELMRLSYISSQLVLLLVACVLILWAVALVQYEYKSSVGVSLLCATVMVIVSIHPLIWRTKKTVVKPRQIPYAVSYSLVCFTAYIFTLVMNYAF